MQTLKAYFKINAGTSNSAGLFC